MRGQLLWLFTLGLVSSLWAQAPAQVSGWVQVRPDLACGGQPSEAALRALAAAGYRTIIDNRLPGELRPFDEAQLVASLGLRYVSIPVGRPESITPELVRAFARAIEESPKPIYMHCASGNRSAQLYYGYLRLKGHSPEQAKAEARRAGLRDTTALPYVERAVQYWLRQPKRGGTP